MDVARDVLHVLNETGRVSDPGRWIPRLVAEQEAANEAALPHSQT